MSGLSVRGLLVAALLCATSTALAEEVYTATVIVRTGVGEPTKERLILTVETFDTEDDTDRLQKILEEEGSERMFEVLRETRRGVAEIENGPRRTINYVRVRPAENGSSVVIVTDTPLYLTEEIPNPREALAVGYIQFALNDRGRGSGQAAAATRMEITDEGALGLAAIAGTSFKLEELLQQR